MQYLLRLGDTCLILAQRLAEWCGHAPVLEEDIALANMALDLLGQARARAHARRQLEGVAAGARRRPARLPARRARLPQRDLVELPRGDFAVTMLRNSMMATWLELMWQRLAGSSDSELAAIAGKAVKEARYHREHAADWVVRLGDGTEESRRAPARRARRCSGRTRASCSMPTRWTARGRRRPRARAGPTCASLAGRMRAVLTAAGLGLPAEPKFRSTGKRGTHSEHMGYVLAEMQYLQRAYPGGAW